MKILYVSLILSLATLFTGCRNKNEEGGDKNKDDTRFFTTPPEKVDELANNQLLKEPTHFLRSQASSSIHWQPWTPEVLDLAERSQKLIFVFVGSSSHPRSFTFAELLESKFGEEINEDYVPVMGDIKVDSSLAQACHFLSSERGEPISFPYLLWLSHEGNPIAWLPVSQANEDDLLLGFRRAQNTVQAIRKKSIRYVVENSRYDNENRLARIDGAIAMKGISDEKKKEPTLDQIFLISQALTNYYDPIELSFDNTGGIPPGNLITTLARIGQHPACPSRLKKNITEATRDSVKNLTQSAIFDPLDHYFFARRNSRSFSIPSLSKNLRTQGEMLSAIASAPSTPASQWASSAMLEKLAREPFLASSILPGETNEMAYFWGLDTLSDFLSKEELKVAQSAFDLRKLGNISTTDDPKRVYFRRNTLGQARIGQELASATGFSKAEAETHFASAIEKIKSRRDEILQAGNSEYKETSSILANKARLLTALCRSYASNPRQSTMDYLESLGSEILTEHRNEDSSLIRIPAQETSRSAPALAYDYATTIEALLEWYRLTLKPELLQEARELTTLFLDNFVTEKNHLVEAKVTETPFTFTISATSMVFGPSTWGTSYGILNRMKALGFEHPKLEPVLDIISPLLHYSLEQTPVIHTDYLLAAANNLGGHVLILSSQMSQNQKLRLALNSATYDSVFVVAEDPALANLPSLNGKAAILLKKGKVTSSFSSAEEVLSGVRNTLKR